MFKISFDKNTILSNTKFKTNFTDEIYINPNKNKYIPRERFLDPTSLLSILYMDLTESVNLT